MTDERLELLRQLVALSEEHLEAARALDAPRIQEIVTRRTDVMFALSVAMQDGLPEDPELIEELRDGTKRLRDLERRTQDVATVVLGALGRVLPARPSTYGRYGELRP